MSLNPKPCAAPFSCEASRLIQRKPPWLYALALASFVAVIPPAALAADAGNSQSYAVHLPVTLAPHAPLQRIVLSSEVMMQLQSARYSDLRIFNAQGQAVPMALAGAAAWTQTERKQVTLEAYPIMGPVNAPGFEGLSVRIEEQQGKRTVQLNSGRPAAGGALMPQRVLGALLDARAVAAPVASMTLEVDLPANQPVNIQTHASKDLKNWRLLADTVMYRSEGGTSRTAASPPDQRLGTDAVDLNMANLAGHYLRITWTDAAGQHAPVTVRQAVLTTSSNTLQRVTANLVPPPLANPHALRFMLPFATPVAAIRVVPQGSNVLFEVDVRGRNESSEAWTLLGSTVLYRLNNAGKEQLNGPFELKHAGYREIRIEADAGTPGFTQAPDISLQFEPVQIVFLTSGQGPFMLAAGLAGTVGAYLPVASLMPGYQSGQENALPLAQLDTSSLSAPVTLLARAEGVPTRTLMLWAILLLGVAALVLMAWALLRQARKPPQPSL